MQKFPLLTACLFLIAAHASAQHPSPLARPLPPVRIATQTGPDSDIWPGTQDPYLLMRKTDDGQRASRLLRVTNDCTTCYPPRSGPFLIGFASVWHDYAIRLVAITTFGGGSTDANYFFRDPRNGHNFVWTQICHGDASCEYIMDLPWLPNPDYDIAAIGDFNQDNNADIVWRNPATGAVALWLLGPVVRNQSVALQGIVDLPSLPANFVITGADDFNLDGYDDIVWHNAAKGNNAIWIMNGTTLASIVNLPVIPNLDYMPVAVGDYDQDGRPDIVWRNVADGRTAVWVMNGTTLAAVTDTFTETDPDYIAAVVGPR
jgi:hypothetical protein